MSDPVRAERWVRDLLERARVAVEAHPPGPGDSSIEQYEQQLRGLVAAFLRPTRHYVGLTVDEAQVLAQSDDDRLCVHEGRSAGHRADLTPRRVHVIAGADGRITGAHRDRCPWDPPRR